MESNEEKQQQQPQPHAICIPFPAQGHINPMLKLAILLHQKGFHITFVNTEYNHNRLLKSKGSTALEGSRDFQFATIPDGLPLVEDDDGNSTQDVPSLCFSTRKNCLAPLIELIHKLNSSIVVPRVSCIFTDSVMSFALYAAEEIGVPGLLLRTASACSYMMYKHITRLVDEGLVPLKDESCLRNGYLNTPINWVPGMTGISICLKDFSTFIRTTDPNDPILNFVITETARSSKASAIILNTFEELEHNVLSAMSAMCPPLYTIGPLHLLFSQKINSETNTLKLMSSSLWKEELECLKWLDTRPQSSVIYVNFGSITVLTPAQLVEFAFGLAESKKNFLWVVRPDLIQGENASLPREYWDEIGDRGVVVGWCPQEKVLNHGAVGGFLTHCGWNSILESLGSGVPMLCWPFFADQHVNCRYVCDGWGVGIEIESDVKREEVGFLVKELLEGEKGTVMKKKAMEWKEKVESTIAYGGSSYVHFDKLVTDVLNSNL